jgi:hypothetical protein
VIRPEILELAGLGPFPASQNVNLDLIKKQEELLRGIKPPITADEVMQLVKLFGPDDYYGLAWTLVHLIETCSAWPMEDCLVDTSNEWIALLKQRLGNK